MLARFLLTVIICGPALLNAAEPFPSVEALMSEKEFSAAGLHKLNEPELNVLRDWLWTYTTRDSEFHRKNSEAPRADSGDGPGNSTAIRSHIVGEFTGWDGDTVFELANGQVWEQRRPTRYRFEATDPEVIIDRNFFGFFEMEVVGANRSVKVKRIK